MNVVDALIFALLALGDLALIVHLRRSRGRRLRAQRIMRSLDLALQQENAAQPYATKRWTSLRRAS
jgi:hypothetical protein